MSLMEKLAKAKEELAEVKTAVENGEKGADELSAAIDGVKDAQAKVDAANEAEKLLKSLGTADGSAKNEGGAEVAAKTLGEHFVEYKKSHESADNRYIATPFKAAGDPTTTSGVTAVQYDKEVVRKPETPLTVLDLFPRKSISEPVYSWPVYKQKTGSAGVTAEGATKNKLTFEYEQKSATLKKRTGLIKMTDELFLSGLIRPGEAFQSVELNRALDPGTYTIYCVFTQVGEDHATVHTQLTVALDVMVRE